MTTPLLHPHPTYVLCNRPVHNSSLIWSGWAWQIPCFKYCLEPAMLQMRSSVLILRPCREAYGTYSSHAKIVRRAAWNNSCLEVCNLCSSSCQFVQVPHLGPTLCIWYFPVKQVQFHYINKHKVKVLLTCGLWRNEILHIFAGQKIVDWLTSHLTWLTTPLVLALLKETEILNHSCQA